MALARLVIGWFCLSRRNSIAAFAFGGKGAYVHNAAKCRNVGNAVLARNRDALRLAVRRGGGEQPWSYLVSRLRIDNRSNARDLRGIGGVWMGLCELSTIIVEIQP